MSTSPVLTREGPQQQYAPAFADVERRVGGEAAWLLELRRAAFARFQEAGFPTAHDEAWKYTSPARIGSLGR